MKSTDDLMNELSKESCKINRFLRSNPDSFVYENIHDFWESVIKKSGFSKSNIINKSDFSYCYFYDVINGRKIPNKDKIIRLILTMHLNLDDCQQALRLSGRSSLYPRIKRDSIIIFAVNQGLTVFQCNELLIKHGEEPLK